MSSLSDESRWTGLILVVILPTYFLVDHLIQHRLPVLLAFIGLSFLVCCRCRPCMEHVWKVITFWTSFSWLYRVRYVGVTYEKGGLIADIKTQTSVLILDSYFAFPLSSITFLGLVQVLLPLLGMIALIRNRKGMFRIFAWAALLISFVGMLHQFGMANQMMTTTFWTAACLIWMIEGDHSELEHTAVVGQWVVAFMFFGAVLGKLTMGYWTNEISEKLGRSSPFPIEWLTVGRLAILGEGIAALSFILHPFLASLVGLFVMSGMLVTVSPNVIEPAGPLVGLCLTTVILLWDTERSLSDA